MAKTDPTKPHPQRTGLPPPRTPNTRTPRTRTSHTRARVRVTKLPAAPFTASLTVPARPYQPLQNELLQGEQRRWFEREVGALQRLARTERLLGDYVAAQRLERELDSFILEAYEFLEKERK